MNEQPGPLAGQGILPPDRIAPDVGLVRIAGHAAIDFPLDMG